MYLCAFCLCLFIDVCVCVCGCPCGRCPQGEQPNLSDQENYVFGGKHTECINPEGAPPSTTHGSNCWQGLLCVSVCV